MEEQGIGWAIKQMNNGNCVRRQGWNGNTTGKSFQLPSQKQGAVPTRLPLHPPSQRKNEMPQTVQEFAAPSSEYTERTVLGAMMFDPVSLADGVASLIVADFFTDTHQRIFRAILSLHKLGTPFDEVAVAEELKRKGEIDAAGGFGYVVELPNGIPRKVAIQSHIRTLRELRSRRSAIMMGEQLAASASLGDFSTSAMIAPARKWLDDIENDAGTDAPMESVAEYLANRYADEERIFDLDPREQGVPSGFPWQDDKTGGYIPGKLYILAARPSMGKTAKAINDVCNMALKARVPVALFTFEQPKDELLQRLLCCRATASLTDFIKGRSDYGDKEAIRKAFRDYQEAPLYWDDAHGLTASQIRARCLRLKKKIGNLAAVVIDQMSFMSWDDVYEKGLRPDQLIGRMTRSLKRMARELHVPVILLCQLGRSATKNKDARPTLADLKESGAIEENADVVAFLHRAEYYDRSDPSLKGKGEYIIAKQRQGPVGSHVLSYIAASCKWVDKWEPKDGEDDGSQIPW